MWLLHLVCQGKVVSASLLGRYYLGVVHVYLVDTVVGLTSIELSEYVFSKFIVSDKVSCLMFPNEFVHSCINRDFVVAKLRAERIRVYCSLCVVLDHLCHLLLILVYRIHCVCWFSLLTSMEFHIIWVDRRVICAVLFRIFLIVESLVASYQSSTLPRQSLSKNTECASMSGCSL